MLVECDRCGAPLDVKEGQRLTKCGYCRSTQQVKNLRTQEIRTPQNWQPPPQWTPQDHRRDQFPQPLPLSPVATFVKWQVIQTFMGLAVGVVVLVGAGIAAWMKQGSSISGLSLTATPSLGLFEVGPVFPVRFDRPGIAGGPIEASRLAPACRGHLPRAPHAVVRIQQPSQLALTTVSSGTDLTMAVRGPDGSVRCDDDGGEGSNPRIQGPFVPGEYRVWIGTFSADQTAMFTLSVQVLATGSAIDLNGLAPDARAQFGTIDLETDGGSDSRAGRASGMVDGNHVNNSCRGWYPSAPVANLRVGQPRLISLTTQSETDLTLLVRDPTGRIMCDDDSGYGANARIDTMATPGVYQVWVGTFSQNTESAYTFSVASEPVPTVSDSSGFAPDGVPSFGTIDLATNTLPPTFHGVAVRRVDATPVDPSCDAGFMASPTIALRTPAAQSVMLSFAGPHDLAVLVQAADGGRHCQGRRGNSVAVPLDLHPGTTLVWVGTPERERHVPFALTVHAGGGHAAHGRAPTGRPEAVEF